MNILFATVISAIGLLCAGANAQKPSPNAALSDREGQHWVGTWATAPEHFVPGDIETFQNQTLRLIVHTSVSGTKVRVKISNTFSDLPLLIGRAHIARRISGPDVDPASDRLLTFGGFSSTKVATWSMVISDPVDLDVPALSDLAISIFLPESTRAATSHLLALQTSYVSDTNGDVTGAPSFPKAKPIDTWPLLT
jgi:hypothetical protein